VKPESPRLLMQAVISYEKLQLNYKESRHEGDNFRTLLSVRILNAQVHQHINNKEKRTQNLQKSRNRTKQC
jgi:hypothetical protein